MNETAKSDPVRAHSFEIKRPAGTAPLHLPPDWLVGKHAVQAGGEVVAWAKSKAVADALVAALAQQAGAAQPAAQSDEYLAALDSLWNHFGGNGHPLYQQFLAFVDSAKPAPQPAIPEGMVPASALRDLYRAYVRLLESGRDRIRELGGACDAVDVMEAGDIDLRAARDVLAQHNREGV